MYDKTGLLKIKREKLLEAKDALSRLSKEFIEINKKINGSYIPIRRLRTLFLIKEKMKPLDHYLQYGGLDISMHYYVHGVLDNREWMIMSILYEGDTPDMEDIDSWLESEEAYLTLEQYSGVNYLLHKEKLIDKYGA